MPITLIHADDVASARRAREELSRGRPVAVPTETVYGLLADVRNPRNVDFLRRSGASPIAGPLAVHLGPSYPVHDFSGRAGGLFRRLIRKAWPGPLTIILEQPEKEFGPAFHALAEPVQNEIVLRRPDGSLAVQLRCPQEAWTGGFLDAAAKESFFPLVAVGLAAGTAPAVEASEARQALEERAARWTEAGPCELLVDAGRTRYAKPSTVIRIRQNRWSLVRAGVWDERTVRRLAQLTLLFVCTGNTCRSPMATALAGQALARKLGISMDELDARGIEISSAGVAAIEGMPASRTAVTTMQRRGLDLSRHHSRRLTAALAQGADSVLVMTPAQRDEVIATMPAISDKVRLLGEKPVLDPAGGDEKEYEAVAREIEAAVSRLVEGLDL